MELNGEHGWFYNHAPPTATCNVRPSNGTNKVMKDGHYVASMKGGHFICLRPFKHLAEQVKWYLGMPIL